MYSTGSASHDGPAADCNVCRGRSGWRRSQTVFQIRALALKRQYPPTCIHGPMVSPTDSEQSRHNSGKCGTDYLPFNPQSRLPADLLNEAGQAICLNGQDHALVLLRDESLTRLIGRTLISALDVLLATLTV